MILTKGATVIDIGKTTSFSGGTEKVQSSVRTGNGVKFSQTWDFSINSKTFKFTGMSETNLALLLDFHLNIVNGIAEPFTLEEDNGDNYDCKFTDKKINFTYDKNVILEGVAETEIYNVSFSIEKENA